MPYSSSFSGEGGTDRVHAAGGGVVPRPAVPARSRVPTQGAESLRPDTLSLWAVALHLGLSVARNFAPPGTPTPPPSQHSPSVSPAAPSRTGALSFRETLE